MDNDLKFALFLSVVFHVIVFFVFSYRSNRIVYINLPVELFFYSAPSQPDIAKEVLPKEDEIVLPRKVKKPKEKKIEKKKAEAKRETPAEEIKETPPHPLTPSSQLTLESAKFPYAYYLNMVKNKINSNWAWSEEFGQLRIQVYFTISRQGTVDDVEIKKSSNDWNFDNLAIRAIRLSEPFPPLPAGYMEDTIRIIFEFKTE